MISWTDVNLLQKQRLDLQVKLDNLLKSGSSSEDDINEIKSEITHLDKDIKRILGTNEIERQKKLRSDSNDEKIKKKYYSLKRKYDLINKLNEATVNLMNTIELNNEFQNSSQVVKVKI